MLGAIIGDIVGSRFEHDEHKSKDFPFFDESCFFTDDTVCTVAVADCLMNGGDPAAYLRKWGRLYPNKGYGGLFSGWLKRDDAAPYNSWGNGAAMRISPAAHLFPTLKKSLVAAEEVTSVTHNHPFAIKYVKALVTAIFMARNGATKKKIEGVMTDKFRLAMWETIPEIRKRYKFYVSCEETVPEAIVCALNSNSFEDAIRNAVSIGGDSDTVAAIAGSLAEAIYGVPEEFEAQARTLLPADVLEIVDRFYSLKSVN